MKETQISRNVF